MTPLGSNVIGLDTSISCITSVCILYSVVVVFISLVSFKSLNEPHVFVRFATTRKLQGSFLPVTLKVKRHDQKNSLTSCTG